MPFQVSPGVNVSEIDLTTVVPAVSTTEGAIAGVFRWGPVGERVLVDSESYLAARFGKPTNHNAETFFTGANFLAYGNKLYVVRAANTTSSNASVVVRSAVANTGSLTDPNEFNVKNEDHYNTLTFIDTDGKYIAKYPGAIGNSLKISVCDSEAAYSNAINIANNGNAGEVSTTSNVTFTVGSSNVVVSVITGTGTITTTNEIGRAHV